MPDKTAEKADRPVFQFATGSSVRALIIRIGFGGISYYNYNDYKKESPKPYSNY